MFWKVSLFLKNRKWGEKGKSSSSHHYWPRIDGWDCNSLFVTGLKMKPTSKWQTETRQYSRSLMILSSLGYTINYSPFQTSYCVNKHLIIVSRVVLYVLWSMASQAKRTGPQGQVLRILCSIGLCFFSLVLGSGHCQPV